MKKSDMLRNLNKNIGAKPIDESDVANVTDYLSTGIYSLNRILSGSIYGGFPVGRITTVAGESQSGKSLIAANTVIEAVNNDKVDNVIIFDTEGGVPVNYIRSHCKDMSKILYVPIPSLEECGAKLIATAQGLVKMKEEYDEDPVNNEYIRTLIVLDSIGGLSTDKLVDDSEKKGVLVPDMGQAAKTRNNIMRGLMLRIPMSGSTMIIVNHIFDNPGAMFASKIKNMAGGKGVEYSSHCIVQCEKYLVKSSDTDYSTGFETEEDDGNSAFFKGNRLSLFVRKTRLVKPFQQAQIYLSMQHGYNKWDGLVEPAIEYGFIKYERGRYVVPSYSDKKIFYKDLMTNDEIWNTFIADFDEMSKKKLSYDGDNETTNAIEEIESKLED